MEATDLNKIASIAASVIAMFNLNSLQKSKVNAYVKENRYEWMEKRKRDSEIESLILERVREVARE